MYGRGNAAPANNYDYGISDDDDDYIEREYPVMNTQIAQFAQYYQDDIEDFEGKRKDTSAHIRR